MDRISSLPDELLCHILSFRTTKEAALTSVLSKRWRNLFACVPTLDLDDSTFLHPEEGKGDREEIIESFMDFVDRVLVLQGDSPIEKVTLRCQTGLHAHRVNSWICNVLARGVSDLDIFIDIAPTYELPEEIYISKTLVDLKVGSGYNINWWAPIGTCMPRLKTLVLASGGFQNFQTLLPACPALEMLAITSMLWLDTNVTVSSPNLKEITIDFRGFSDILTLKTLSFDAPGLLFFYYCDSLREDYPEVNFKDLVEAHIHMVLTQDQIEQVRAQNYNEVEGDVFPGLANAWKLVNGLRNVEELYLSPDTLELLYRCREAIPVFKNLKMLSITSDEGRGWQAVPVLLKRCPHLETLVIEGLSHFVTDECGYACDCILRDSVPQELKVTSCPVEKLKVYEFEGTEKEFGMIKHLLEYFPRLEEMEIYASENCPALYKNPTNCYAVLKSLNLDDKLSSSTVQFLPPEWTAQ